MPAQSFYHYCGEIWGHFKEERPKVYHLSWMAKIRGFFTNHFLGYSNPGSFEAARRRAYVMEGSKARDRAEEMEEAILASEEIKIYLSVVRAQFPEQKEHKKALSLTTESAQILQQAHPKPGKLSATESQDLLSSQEQKAGFDAGAQELATFFRGINADGPKKSRFKNIFAGIYLALGLDLKSEEKKICNIRLAIKKYILERLIGESLVLFPEYTLYKLTPSKETLSNLMHALAKVHPALLSRMNDEVVQIKGRVKLMLREAIEIYICSRAQWELANVGEAFYRPYTEPYTAFAIGMASLADTTLNRQRRASGVVPSTGQQPPKSPRSISLAVVRQDSASPPEKKALSPASSKGLELPGQVPENEKPAGLPELKLSIKVEKDAQAPEEEDEELIPAKVEALLPVLPSFWNVVGLNLLNPFYWVDALGHLFFNNLLKGFFAGFHASMDCCIDKLERPLLNRIGKGLLGLVTAPLTLALMLGNLTTFVVGKMGSLQAWQDLQGFSKETRQTFAAKSKDGSQRFLNCFGLGSEPKVLSIPTYVDTGDEKEFTTGQGYSAKASPRRRTPTHQTILIQVQSSSKTTEEGTYLTVPSRQPSVTKGTESPQPESPPMLPKQFKLL